MQNSLNKEQNIVEFTSKTTVDVTRGVSTPAELASHPKMNLQEGPRTAQVTPIKARAIYVIKKDGTKEPFDATKIINAVKKSATRALVQFTEEDLKEICDFVDNNIARMCKEEVFMPQLFNIKNLTNLVYSFFVSSKFYHIITDFSILFFRINCD